MCAVLLVLSVPWGAARAEDKNKGNPYISATIRLYEALEYEEALQTLEKAAKWPSNTPEDDVDIALLEGILIFEINQEDRARTAFRRALAINPDAQAPVPVSPKIAAQLEKLRPPRSPPPEPHGDPPLNPGFKPTPPPRPPRQPLLTRLDPYRLPIAIRGGVVALGGALSWAKALSIDQRVRTADTSITTRTQLDGTLREGQAFQTAGWLLFGAGAAASIGSLLLLEDSTSRPTLQALPTQGGSHVSLRWSLP